jgi:hypothetical protein
MRGRTSPDSPSLSCATTLYHLALGDGIGDGFPASRGHGSRGVQQRTGFAEKPTTSRCVGSHFFDDHGMQETAAGDRPAAMAKRLGDARGGTSRASPHSWSPSSSATQQRSHPCPRRVAVCSGAPTSLAAGASRARRSGSFARDNNRA